MKNKQSFLENLFKILQESDILTERKQVENPLNTTTAINRYNRKNLDKLSQEDREKTFRRTEDEILRNKIKQAGYTWKGIAPNYKSNFLYSPATTFVIDGDVESYKDPLWFKLTKNEHRKGFQLKKLVDEDGIILPGYREIIKNRLKKKYGIEIDPNQSVINIKSGDHNYEEFYKWAIKYFIPWYTKNSKEGTTQRNQISSEYTYDIDQFSDPENLRRRKSIEKDNPSVISNVKTTSKTTDKSVIDSIVNSFFSKPKDYIEELEKLTNDASEIKSYPQQIYNTLKELYKRCGIYKPIYQPKLRELIDKYEIKYPEFVNESIEEDDSWLKRNGDYSIFDKLNNIFRLKKESVEKTMTNTRVKLQEDNVFDSISTDENNFDPSKISSDIFNDEENTGLSEKDENKKNKLTRQVIDKINKSLSINKEVQNILDEIREINNNNSYNVWVVNEEGNTASLASKNAKIFKQNLNLCLSHDNKIEIFKSVKELHNWLREHNYPLPRNIQLHESVLTEKEIGKFLYSDDDPRSRYNGLGKWIEILNLDVIGQKEEDYKKILSDRDKDIQNKNNYNLGEDFCCGNMGGTTGASLGTSLYYLYKNRNKKESLDKTSFVNKLKQLKEDDTDVSASFDSAIQKDAGFGTDSSSSGLDTTSMDSDLNSDFNKTDDVDLSQDSVTDNSPMGFGDINIGSSGYGPDSNVSDEDEMTMNIPQTEYKIIDVLSDKEGNVKVKIQETSPDTNEPGKIEYKDLSEIDI